MNTRVDPKKIEGADLIDFDRDYCSRSLARYLRRSWTVVDSERYDHNWHMDAIGEHLEAVTDGEITRLLINVPPGTSKSSATCVFYPAWLWGARNLPHKKFISASFSLDNAKRDNRKTRNMVESEWYQNRWKTNLTITQEQYLENDKKGFRQCSSVTGITGKRGDVVVWDDPLNPEMANSETERNTANRVFSETLPNRLISPKRSAIIIIMQRLHEYDVSGYILANDLDYEHLCLPMEFEKARKCYTSIGFEDPRKVEGELLHSERFPDWVVARDKKVMGEYAYAGQNQQRPAPREGGLFKRADFNFIPARPAGMTWVRGWDLAASIEKTSAFTAGVLLGFQPVTGRYCLADCVKVQGLPHEVEALLRSTAAEDGYNIRGSLPQDPGAGGKSAAVHLVTRVVAGYPYFYSTEDGDKERRADPFAAQVAAGNVDIVIGKWNKAYLDEAEVFPSGRFLDQIDATSRAFMTLTNMNLSTGGLKGSYGKPN